MLVGQFMSRVFRERGEMYSMNTAKEATQAPSQPEKAKRGAYDLEKVMSTVLKTGSTRIKKSLLPIPIKGGTIKQTFVLRNVLGLHHRPAMLLITTLRDFDCESNVECGGTTANARSILGLLSIAAGYRSKLTFVFKGRDATEAMTAIQRLFDENFSEAYDDMRVVANNSSP
jgi:phosphocarrier protein HPr